MRTVGAAYDRAQAVLRRRRLGWVLPALPMLPSFIVFVILGVDTDPWLPRILVGLLTAGGLAGSSRLWHRLPPWPYEPAARPAYPPPVRDVPPGGAVRR